MAGCKAKSRGVTSVSIVVMLLLGITACSSKNATENQADQANSNQPHYESSLTFSDVTLEQTNAQGKPVWNVKAKQAIYSQDKKVARVQSPTGELFQDGKVAYQITAAQGEIQQDGKKLFLNGRIVAVDPKNGVILHGNELEWRPDEDLLIVRNHLTVNHQQMQLTAQEARVFSRASRMELQGQVVAIAANPRLQVRTEHLIWQIKEQKLIGDRPVQIARFNGQTITDQAAANQADVDLNTKIVTLKQNAQLSLVDALNSSPAGTRQQKDNPPLQVASNELSWNLNAETLTANQPIRILDRTHQVTVTANQGWMDLQKKVAYLTGKVYGVGQRGQSLQSIHLTWYLPSQLFEANGDVVYHQVEPVASFTGQKAVGKLQDQSIVVSGGGVVTQFTP
ncbi:MAG: LPS export ABC transporter periplasmic protein LptC [Chroococcidiopsidaceae cyanobacterium CP_BM_RX_35]|nr:LPS export ABC transporter periplasmic protein LptC [Chroococcidiopsidaceae cyanobacterium CP_BM_RX_35]